MTPPSPEKAAHWARRFDAGESWRAIAAAAGVDESTVRRHAGPLVASRRSGPRRRPDLDDGEVLRLHGQGYGQRRIAAALDCSVQAVRLRLSEHGLCAPADRRPRKNDSPDDG